VPLLATKALDLGDGDALNADVGNGLTNIIQFEWLDDGCDEFHEYDLLVEFSCLPVGCA
jgi:hypothetical protein